MSTLGRPSMAVPNPAPAAEPQGYYEDDDDGWDQCQTCCGDGYEECWDWPDCWEPKCDGDFHRCPNCHGTGSAKDQWYW